MPDARLALRRQPLTRPRQTEPAAAVPLTACADLIRLFGDEQDVQLSRPYLRRRTYNCVRVRPRSLAAFDLLCLASRSAFSMAARSSDFRSPAPSPAAAVAGGAAGA